MVYTEGMLER